MKKSSVAGNSATHVSENGKVAENYSIQKMLVRMKVQPPYILRVCQSVQLLIKICCRWLAVLCELRSIRALQSTASSWWAEFVDFR